MEVLYRSYGFPLTVSVISISQLFAGAKFLVTFLKHALKIANDILSLSFTRASGLKCIMHYCALLLCTFPHFFFLKFLVTFLKHAMHRSRSPSI